MKSSVKILSLTVALFLAGNLFAQDSLQVQNRKMNRHNQQNSIASQTSGQKSGFVDLNGDGYNDNAPDADGDGIPNGQDPDYVRTMGSSNSHGKGFVDLDGDGINDNALDADGDGIPNGQDPDYVRPMDGSGAQNGHSMKAGTGAGLGTGDCTGTRTQKGKKGGRK